jgi:hypothetical protein
VKANFVGKNVTCFVFLTRIQVAAGTAAAPQIASSVVIPTEPGRLRVRLLADLSAQGDDNMLKNIGIFGALAAMSLAACSTRTVERQVIHTPAAQPAVVQVAPAPAPVVVATVQPPPAQVETVPPAPAADMIWTPGYWNFVNGQYVWVAGRYEPAKIGYVWAPNRWEHVNGRWQMTGGAWVRQ